MALVLRSLFFGTAPVDGRNRSTSISRVIHKTAAQALANGDRFVPLDDLKLADAERPSEQL